MGFYKQEYWPISRYNVSWAFNICYTSCSEKAMAPHSSTLAWKITWTEKPGRLQCMVSQRVGHGWATSLSLFTFMQEKEMPTHPSVLAWRIPGSGDAGGLLSMGSHRVGNDWSDLAAYLMLSSKSSGVGYHYLLLRIEFASLASHAQTGRFPYLRSLKLFCILRQPCDISILIPIF